MSKIINFSEPLTADDEIYLSTRPWLKAQAERQGFELQYASDDFLDPETPESPEEPEEPVNYGKMNIKALQAEIERRNEEREDEEDHIVADSNSKGDLMAALALDDESAE
jgi:hypothetical protein